MGLSEEVKSLISGCLKVNPHQRLNIHQVAAHPWLQGKTIPGNQVTRNTRNTELLFPPTERKRSSVFLVFLVTWLPGMVLPWSQGWAATWWMFNLWWGFTLRQPLIKLFTSSLSFNWGNQVRWALEI